MTEFRQKTQGFAAPAASKHLTDPLSWLATGAIFFLVLVNIALISLAIASIPVRSILSVVLLGIFSILRPNVLQRAVSRHSLVFLLAGILAAAGCFSSFVNGANAAVVFRSLLEVHVQAIVTLLFAAVASELAGPRAAVAAFVGAVGVSAGVAFMQMGGLDFAWSLREALGGLQDHDLHEDSSFLNRRPMGLSFSPIHLATQACLAFAAYTGLKFWEQETAATSTIDWRFLLAVGALVAVSITCATRSPILGAAIFLAGYLAMKGGKAAAILLLASGGALYLAAPIILDAMQGSEMRAFRAGDNSSTGRLPLVTFGMLLFLDNPLGYGFDFASQDHWTKFWPEIYSMPSAGVIRVAELHNYFLNMLTTYGIGLLLTVPLVALLLWRGREFLPVFIPYIAHITFHNSGPFWNDTLFWFVIGTFYAMRAAGAGDEAPKSRKHAVPWPPAFRPRAKT